jgi:HSP20 family molecular chaperone IbpA
MTTLVRFREPLRNVTMNREFERLINSVFESPARAAALSNHAWTPPLDIWETEGELVYAFDLPGIAEEKIAVEFEDSTLTVSGSRERTALLEEGRFFRYERPFGEFMRSVALPEGTGDCEAKAHYANGVLEVHVQKPEQSKPRSIPVMTTVEAGSTD